MASLPAPPAHRVEGFNPLCGDEIVVYLDVDNGTVTDVKIGGQGCSISQSSASMMSAAVKGKTVAEARALIRAFKAMMSIHEHRLDGDGATRRPRAGDAEVKLGDLEALQGVVKFPVRIKCATLSWNTLAQGLDEGGVRGRGGRGEGGGGTLSGGGGGGGARGGEKKERRGPGGGGGGGGGGGCGAGGPPGGDEGGDPGPPGGGGACPEGLGAQLLLGRRATALDLAGQSVTLDTGDELPFDGLVIATGAAARRLPGTGELAGVHVLRTIDDLIGLRADLAGNPRVAIIGAGFIGCEVASSCRDLGLAVTVVEGLPLPLIRVLGREMGTFASGLLRNHDVDLRLGQSVAALEGDGHVERVRLADGSGIEADVVVVGIGVYPNTAWLETSGLALDDGVVCDAWLRADGRPDIVAAGDVARWPNELFAELMRVEHWTNAAEQGEHAARTLLFGADASGRFTPVPYFWSDQFGTKYQFVGTARPEDEVQVVEGSMDDGKFVAAYGRNGIAVGALCLNRANRTIQWSQLIAAKTALTAIEGWAL